MSFIWPVMLSSLLLLPLLVALYGRAQRRRRRLAADHGGFGLAHEAAGRRLGLRRHIPPALFLVALALLGIALARPRTVVSLPRLEGTVILAFDVSGSMTADDLQPTRLAAARVAAQDFVRRQPPAVRIGVVAFSASGLAVQAPTNDQGAVLAAIDRLAPAQGTSLANGILASLVAIEAAESDQPPRFYSNLTPVPTVAPTPVPAGQRAPAVVVLLTDGENSLPPDPLAAAQVAAERGVRIHTVGIGSAAGTTLRIEGFSVFTRLDEATLQGIAERTGGDYYNAENEGDLRAIYEGLDTRLAVRPEVTEVTSIFSGAGLLALLLGGACSLWWFGRVP